MGRIYPSSFAGALSLTIHQSIVSPQVLPLRYLGHGRPVRQGKSKPTNSKHEMSRLSDQQTLKLVFKYTLHSWGGPVNQEHAELIKSVYRRIRSKRSTTALNTCAPSHILDSEHLSMLCLRAFDLSVTSILQTTFITRTLSAYIHPS